MLVRQFVAWHCCSCLAGCLAHRTLTSMAVEMLDDDDDDDDDDVCVCV
jgi:hypothetical protein